MFKIPNKLETFNSSFLLEQIDFKQPPEKKTGQIKKRPTSLKHSDQESNLTAELNEGVLDLLKYK